MQCFCRNLPTKIEFKSMSEYNQAEDIKILMEKVKREELFFLSFEVRSQQSYYRSGIYDR